MKSGSKAFVLYNKKLLLILRDDKPDIPFPNVWNLPGGGIEEGETPEEAIKRELKEEICVVPKYIEFIGEEEYSSGVTAYRFASFLTDEEKTQVKHGDEGQRLDFFTMDEAEKLNLTPIFREYFDKNKDKIRALVEEKKLFRI